VIFNENIQFVMFIMLGLLGAFLVFMAVLTFHTHWVSNAIVGVLSHPNMTTREQLAEYDRLPDFKTMALRWWVWDIEKFKTQVEDKQ